MEERETSARFPARCRLGRVTITAVSQPTVLPQAESPSLPSSVGGLFQTVRHETLRLGLVVTKYTVGKRVGNEVQPPSPRFQRRRTVVEPRLQDSGADRLALYARRGALDIRVLVVATCN